MKLAYVTHIRTFKQIEFRRARKRRKYFTCPYGIAALKDKIKLWKIKVNDGNVDMFPKNLLK
jgi:hypothetical protein